MRMKQVQTGLALYPFIAPSPPTPPPPAVAGPFVPVDLSAPLSAKHIFTRYLSYDLGRSLNPNNLPLAAGVMPSQHMKWVGSLGWWMGSDAILTGGRLYTDSHFTTELADMRSSPASVIGYRAFVTFAHIDPNNANGVQANYHFADIDGMKASIAGKKFAIQFNMGVFNNPTPALPNGAV